MSDEGAKTEESSGSEEASSSEETTWSSTQKAIIQGQKEIQGNKIWESEEHEIQKKFPVPVYSDQGDVDLDLYTIDITTVSYNFKNGRLRKYLKFACRQNGIDPEVGLDEENPEHQKIIHNLLLNTKSYSHRSVASLKDDLKLKGQQKPVYATENGVLWNGNRRTAVMRELLDEGNTEKEWARLKIVFLPEGLTPPKLRDLEKREQEEPDTKEDYGRVNEMIECRRGIDEYTFDSGDYTSATQDEQKEIIAEVGVGEWDTWSKITQAKRVMDLIDGYLDDRDTEAEPMTGNYSEIEGSDGSGVTWFERLDLVLNQVTNHYNTHTAQGDPDEKYDAYKAALCAAYDAGDADYQHLDKIKKTINQARGDGSARDTQNMMNTFESSSTTITNWAEVSQEPESLINNDTLSTAEVGNLQRNSRDYLQLGKSPKTKLDDVKNDIHVIVEDGMVVAGDQEVLDIIKECKDELEELENQAKGQT